MKFEMTVETENFGQVGLEDFCRLLLHAGRIVVEESADSHITETVTHSIACPLILRGEVVGTLEFENVK